MRFRITGLFIGVALLGSQFVSGQDAKKGPADLQGTWKLTRYEVDGEARMLPANLPPWVIKDSKVRYGGEALAKLVVDPSTRPPSIDLALIDVPNQHEGIFAIDGNVLKLCLSRNRDVKERPLDFETAGKSERYLLVFERQKAGADDGAVGGTGFIGIQIKLDKDTDKVVVGGVIKGSPAMKAGLKADDVIQKIAGVVPTDLLSAVEAVRQTRSGKDLVVSIRRGDKDLDITVRAGVFPFRYVIGD